MERKIKQEIMDTSQDYTRSPNIKQEMNLSNIKLETSRSSNVAHDMSESESDSSGSLSDDLPSLENDDSTDDEGEVSSRPRPGTGHEPQRQRMSFSKKVKSKVLDNVVGSPEDYDTVELPGPLTMRDIKHDKEYYIFRFPTGLINPDHLVQTKSRVGGKEAQRIEVNKKSFEVSTYVSPTMADTPTLFLPDASGDLGKVDLEISGHIVIKQPPLNPIENQQFNIDDLRSRIHKPPEIMERNFFDSSGTKSEGETVTPKKTKLSKEEKRLLKEKKRLSKGEKNYAEEMRTVTPGKKKKRSLDPKEISSPLFNPNKIVKNEKEEL